MNKIVNIALQILPSSATIHPYKLVDKAIEVIAASGLKYRVTPFETVMEGTYDEVMEVVKKAQQACYDAGAESMMTYIKIQSSKDADVRIEDKMEKYDK
ncbi:MAG: MTH1187 family thiamine-binding protein [Paludibacteraceae bacterium]|nr:MTH1187 family thiamine-binding protein [Paludibacteraceae bacterium]